MKNNNKYTTQNKTTKERRKIKTSMNEFVYLRQSSVCNCGNKEKSHWQSSLSRDYGFILSAKMEKSSHHSLIYCFTQRQHKSLEEPQQQKVTGCSLMLLLPPLWTTSPHRVAIHLQLLPKSQSPHNMLGGSQWWKKNLSTCSSIWRFYSKTKTAWCLKDQHVGFSAI